MKYEVGGDPADVSLCSLRSLRASMCQVLKIHKARGECQERTKYNDFHRDESTPWDCRENKKKN